MRKSRIAFAVVLSCASATAAWAQQAPTGVQGFYGGGVTWTPYGGQDSASSTLPPDSYNQTFVGSIPFSLSASTSTGGGSASLAISATPNNGNLALHGYGSASFSGSQFEGSNAEAAFDLYAYDTFNIGGPSGTPEQFQYSLTLNGSAQASTDGYPDATEAYGALELYANSNWTEPGAVQPFGSCWNDSPYGYFDAAGNPCGRVTTLTLSPLTPASQTVTGTLTFIGGTTVQLGQLLWARPYASQAQTADAIWDASDTGFFTLTPLTDGASFTTASGLSYAQSPDAVGSVPEPSTWALMLLGFGAIGFAFRRMPVGLPISSTSIAS